MWMYGHPGMYSYPIGSIYLGMCQFYNKGCGRPMEVYIIMHALWILDWQSTQVGSILDLERQG